MTCPIIPVSLKTAPSLRSLLLFFGNNGKSGCHLHMSHDYVLNQVLGKKIVYMFDYYDNDCKFKSIFSNRCNFLDENFFEMAQAYTSK